ADNRLNDVLINGASSGISFVGFNGFSPDFVIRNGFVSGTNTLEFVAFNDATTPNPAGFRARLSGTAQALLPQNTQLIPGPVTAYFRATFTFTGNPTATLLTLRPMVDDGAVFYLDGAEVCRLNLPGGTISSSTPASLDVTNASSSGTLSIPASGLVTGTNVLAVEVHQATNDASDILFGAELLATPAPFIKPSLAFNEIAASTNPVFWLELANSGTNGLPLDGYVLVRDGATDNQFVFPASQTIAAGGYLSLNETQLGFHPQSGDKLFLYPPNRGSVVDAVVVKKTLRGRYPDATGRWLYPAQPTPGGPNRFALHDEIVINEIMYHHRAGTNGESPEGWIELYNRSTNSVDLSGWELDKGIEFEFPPNATMPPGSYLVVTGDTNYLRSFYPDIPMLGNYTKRLSHHSDLIQLKDGRQNPVNEVRYYDDGRWPGYADGDGSSLELRDPFADNSQAEAWAASDESGRSQWKSYSYRGVAAAGIGPALWREFVLGLLD